MDSQAREYWMRFGKSAALLALGAAAHVWLLPSDRSARVADLVNVVAPSGLASSSARPHGASVIGLLESTPDHLAGAVPRSPLAPMPGPLGTSGRVSVSIESVSARSIFDRPRVQTPSDRLASDAIREETAEERSGQGVATDANSSVGTSSEGSGTLRPPGISGTLGTVQPLRTVGTAGTSGIAETSLDGGSRQTPELQLASDGLSPARRLAHDTVALAKPEATTDSPHIAVNARQLLDDEQMVRRVLQQYRTAYEQLDAAAAKNVWPTVDERALTHAFQQLAAQRLTFRSCGISIAGEGANARCRGEAEYLPKIGAKRAYTTSGEWVFDLAREQTAWRIINASVQ